MPFLRSLKNNSCYELCSSKTLIGSGVSTCDLVISGDDVLELHALLDLATNKASAKVIPLCATKDGICYVNDVVLRQEGAFIVHGDRLAFGNPYNNFVFEITPQSQKSAITQRSLKEEEIDQCSASRTGEKRANQQTVDSLCSDRKHFNLDTPGSPSIQHRTSVCLSTDSTSHQLSKYLSEASTDSLLSDYVERKLKQRRSRQSSIVNTSQCGGLDVRQSREQRNVAEVEKLRLSQRIREVNDVLNGDIQFQESYLSPSAKSVRTRKSHGLAKTTYSTGCCSILPPVEDISVATDEEGSEIEGTDELPDMMQKETSNLRSSINPVDFSVSIQTENSEQEVRGEENELPDYSPEREVECDFSQSQHLSNSPHQSYKVPVTRNFMSKAMELGVNNLTRSHCRPTSTERQKAANPMAETNAGQTSQSKTNMIVKSIFVRWKRGLQIQSQNRQCKSQQLAQVRAALGQLRRDQSFLRWRAFAILRSQAMTRRLKAFQQRSQHRLLREWWVAFRNWYFLAKRRSILLRGLAIKKVMKEKLKAFQRWRQFFQTFLTRNQSPEAQCLKQQKLDVFTNRMSDRHYSRQIVQPLLRQVMRRWRKTAEWHKKQQHILRKVLLCILLKQARRAWTKWTETALILKSITNEKKQTEEQIQQIIAHLTCQHDESLSIVKESHANQLQKLMLVITNKDRELEQLKRQQHTEVIRKATCQTKLEQDLRSFLEKAIAYCDERIAQASDQLEKLLQSADDDVYGARYGAAQFLVDSTIQQKIHNANECLCLVTSYIEDPTAFSNQNPAKKSDLELSPNCRYLYDMMQQRLTRLQQLHHSLAKLAAVSNVTGISLDPDRLQHSTFLANAFFQRQQTHLSTMLLQFQRLGLTKPAARA